MGFASERPCDLTNELEALFRAGLKPPLAGGGKGGLPGYESVLGRKVWSQIGLCPGFATYMLQDLGQIIFIPQFPFS